MGFYCAEALAQRGAHVIMAARSLDRTEKAAQMIRVQPRFTVPIHHYFLVEDSSLFV